MMSFWHWLSSGSTTRKSAPLTTTDTKALNSLAKRVTSSASTVFDTLGSGLPEIIYENALAHELRKSGLTVGQKQAIAVYYDGVIVGDYTADLMIQNAILIEMAAVKRYNIIDTRQCLKYLRATGYQLCLVFNFGNPNLEVKRVRNRR